MQIEDKYAHALRIAADLAAENAALWTTLNCGDATIRELNADLDDMQAEWAHEWSRVAATMRTFSDAAHSAITASGISQGVNQGLLDRIATLEQQDRQADEQAEEIARLEAELAKLHGQLGSAHGHIKALEQQNRAKDATIAMFEADDDEYGPRRLEEARGRIAAAIAELTQLGNAGGASAEACHRIANGLRCGPRAPTVPRGKPTEVKDA